MAALAHQIFQHLHRQNKTLIICLDQTAIGDNHAIAMVSVRVGERGLPLLWKTKPIKGNIETACYIKMLKTLADLVPQSAQVIVMADRFFNAGQIIATCKPFGWGWRLRLKQNRILTQDGGEITARERCKHHPLCPCKVMVDWGGSLKQTYRSALSAFKTGLRYLKYCAQNLKIPPPIKIIGW